MASDNPEIFSKRMVQTNYPKTVVKGKHVKNPVKTMMMKGKMTSMKKMPMASKGIPKVGNNLKNEKVMPAKKC